MIWKNNEIGEKTMKCKEGKTLYEIAGEKLILPEASADLTAMLSLNETGAFLWNQLQNETDEDALVAALTQEFCVDEQTARTDVREFIARLKELDLLA